MIAHVIEPFSAPPAPTVAPPRLGFLGVGWTGRHGLEAIASSGLADIAAIADSRRDQALEIARIQPEVAVLESLDDLLEVGLDGVVIATPGALHAEQAVHALERGVAVFCQKPVGRTADETRRVIDTARAAGLLLGTDLSCRFISGIRKIRDLCRKGELGDIFAIDLVFHNARGPGRQQFCDWKLSGAGCAIDLGIDLVDLALWTLDFPRVTRVASRLFAGGKPIHCRCNTVEDHAVARIDLETGTSIRLACSWKLPVGCDAIIAGSFYGTRGGGAFHNVEGSFYDFIAERFHGTRSETLAGPPELWGGRAAVDWTQRLAARSGFDPEIETLLPVAETFDRIYDHSGRTAPIRAASQ